MSTNDKGNLKWIGIAVVAILIAVGILLWFTLKKEDEFELIVTAEDVTVIEGEAKEIEYETSVKAAKVTLVVEDKTVAEIKDEKVLGKQAGETEIIITARYESKVYRKEIKVVVLEKKDNTENTDPSESEDNNSNNTDKEEDNDKEENPPVVESFELEINGKNCEVKEKEIEMTLGKKAVLTIITEEEFGRAKIETSSEKLVVKINTFMNTMLEIEAEEIGEYEVRLRIDNKVAVLKIKVKSL